MLLRTRLSRFAASADGTLTFVNEAFANIATVPRGSWIGKAFTHLINPC